MFSYTGVTPTQVDELTSKYHIYLTRNGRIRSGAVNNLTALIRNSRD